MNQIKDLKSILPSPNVNSRLPGHWDQKYPTKNELVLLDEDVNVFVSILF